MIVVKGNIVHEQLQSLKMYSDRFIEFTVGKSESDQNTPSVLTSKQTKPRVSPN